MPSTKSNRTYSEFFTSGLRAMRNRSKHRVSSTPTPSVRSSDSTSTTKSSRRHSSFVNFANRRSRTTSMIITPSESIKSASSFSSSSSSERRDRRSSLVTFSSWLFDRKASSHSDNYLSFSSSPPRNKRELLNSTDVMEVWITTGGPFSCVPLGSSDSDSSAFQSIDPFASSPDSKSFFIDWADSPSPTRSTDSAKHESFLSFSPSPTDTSLLQTPFRRRDRPTSAQTMPLPSRSHYSSFCRPPSKSVPNTSWTLEEESRPPTPEPVGEDLEERSDPALNIDWRQFHVTVEFLNDDAWY